MRHLARAPSAVAAAALLLAACKESKPRPEAPHVEAPQPAAKAPPKAFTFTLRDLALATAVDASAARVSVAGSDIEAALLSRDAAARAQAAGHVPTLDAARAELDQAVARIANALDQPGAARVQATGKEYATRLAGAARTPEAPFTPELAAARAAFGEALVGYREGRAAWRFDAPPPSGAERDFIEARRDMERAESGFMSRTRVAPREEGHEFDAAGARMAGQMGVEKARAAAAKLPPALQPHAVRYVTAQEKVLQAVNAIQTAPVNEKPALARSYHAAKAEALAALADYFAAVAAR